MKERIAAEIFGLYRDCLQRLYDTAGIEPPKSEFEPEVEANRLTSALFAKGMGIKLKVP